MPKEYFNRKINFVPLGGGSPESKSPPMAKKPFVVPIRIVSWNTLADQYIHHQERDRPSEDWRIFDQGHRHRLLGQVFQRFVDLDVDFICLQEVDFKVAREILVDRNSYTRLLTPTGHGRGDIRVDACCIFYKSSDWSLLGHDIVRFDDLACDNPSSPEFSESLRRGNFGIIAWFQHLLVPNRKVMVSNCHLFWDPKYEYVKLCQAHYLCLRIETILRSMGYDVARDVEVMSVLLCGDFNSLPGGLVHRYLTESIEPPKEVEEIEEIEKSPFLTWNPNSRKSRPVLTWEKPIDWNSGNCRKCPLRCAYFNDAHGHGEERRNFTNSTKDFCGVIDYIFLPGINPMHADKTRMLSLPSAVQGRSPNKHGKTKTPILPSLKWPSDHVAIGFEIDLW